MWRQSCPVVSLLLHHSFPTIHGSLVQPASHYTQSSVPTHWPLNVVCCVWHCPTRALFTVGDKFGNQITKLIDTKLFNSYCNDVHSELLKLIKLRQRKSQPWRRFGYPVLISIYPIHTNSTCLIKPGLEKWKLSKKNCNSGFYAGFRWTYTCFLISQWIWNKITSVSSFSKETILNRV